MEHRRHEGHRCCVMSLLIVVLALPYLAGTPAPAESPRRPFWAEQAMFRFGEDLFFVGQASCAKTAEEGRQRAFVQGVQELLNYAQARSTAGLEIATQMVFEETPAPGCPPQTVTVWRLLRVEAEKVAALPKGTTPHITLEPITPPAAPRDLTPRMGMSREEVLDRFGRPWSISIRKQGTEIIWNYPRFGLTLVLDEENVLRRWRLAGPQGREERAPEVKPAPEKKAPALDLTARLRSLEQTPTSTEGTSQSGPRSTPVPSEVSRPAEPAAPARLASHTFPPTTRTVSGLAAAPLAFGSHPAAQSGPRYAHCDVATFSLSVQHLPDGSGPHVSSDHRFSTATEAQLRQAIKAAATASGYDPRFLSVRLLINLPPVADAALLPTQAIDAEGSVVAWAVTVAAAILNHPLRPGIAILGTIDADLLIQPVADLENRIGACRQSGPLELVVSSNQAPFDVTLRGMGYGLTLTQVHTLADAYEAATGEGLRQPR